MKFDRRFKAFLLAKGCRRVSGPVISEKIRSTVQKPFEIGLDVGHNIIKVSLKKACKFMSLNE